MLETIRLIGNFYTLTTGSGASQDSGEPPASDQQAETQTASADAKQLIEAPQDEEQQVEEMGGGCGERVSLVDRLIDSQLEWRQLIGEANGGQSSARLADELTELQIKRQEVIHELVQTERHHCLTLALMRQVYLTGLRRINETRSRTGRQANCSASHLSLVTTTSQQQQQLSSCESSADLIDLERLFPALDDLIQAHELFFAHLRLKLVDSCQRPQGRLLGLVGPLGELLCEQFRLRRSDGDGDSPSAADKQQQEPANGHKLLQAYAKFCGQHYDSSRYYKHLMLTDKGFKQFIEVSNTDPLALGNYRSIQREANELELNLSQRQRPKQSKLFWIATTTLAAESCPLCCWRPIVHWMSRTQSAITSPRLPVS